MKLLHLELNNFRQHQHTEITFNNGLTGIIGANGAGKTTLIEAVSFALFGSKAIRGKVDDLKTRGLKQGKLEVELSFEQSEVIYKIVRGTHDAKLFVGGENSPLVEGNRETLGRIQYILGMNYEEFVSTFLTEQKGLEFLSGKRGATEREKFIVRMLGYDRLEKIQDGIRSDRRDIKNTLLGSESSIGDRTQLELKLKEESEEVRKIEPEYTEIVALVEKNSLEVDKCKKEYEDRESRRSGWLKAQKELEHLQIRYSENGKRIKALEEKLLVVTNSRVSRYDGPIDAVLSKLHTRKDSLVWAIRKKDEILSRKASLEKLGAMGNCPTCGQELGESHSLAVHELHAALGDIEAEIESSGIVSEIDRDIALLNEEVSLIKEIALLREDLKKLDLAIKNSAEKVKETRFSESDYLAIKGRYEASARVLEITRLQKVKIEGDFKTKQALLKRTQDDLQNFDERVVKVEMLRKELIVLEESDIILTDFRKALNEEIKPKLASIASEFLATLTDGRYLTVEIGSDFSPNIVEDGSSRAVISGGEADILNLSVRLALSHMLAERSGQQFSLLILDEIFGSLDENRRSNVLQLLERLGNHFEQILVITHMDDIKEGVEHLLVVEFDEGLEAASISAQSLEADGIWW